MGVVQARPVALVTGASSGIGLATAAVLLAAGYEVIGAARRLEPMNPLADLGLFPLELDLCHGDSISALASRLRADHPGGVDLLVNNAGYGLFGAVETIPIAAARRQFEVNLFGLAHLTQLLLPAMRERGAGRIINVSSMAGRIYAPLGAWYYASKHALEGWSDCLRVELRPFGISVVIVQPGIIRTDFIEQMRDPLLRSSGFGPYAAVTRGTVEAFERLFASPRASSPELVGRTILRAATAGRPRTRYVVGHLARPLLLLRNLLGDRVYDAITQASFPTGPTQRG
jgi:NAD(P)-dependent dehydrogenase (short-subunit alcohol dehydrogenase family)